MLRVNSKAILDKAALIVDCILLVHGNDELEGNLQNWNHEFPLNCRCKKISSMLGVECTTIRQVEEIAAPWCAFAKPGRGGQIDSTVHLETSHVPASSWAPQKHASMFFLDLQEWGEVLQTLCMASSRVCAPHPCLVQLPSLSWREHKRGEGEGRGGGGSQILEGSALIYLILRQTFRCASALSAANRRRALRFAILRAVNRFLLHGRHTW